MEKCQVSGWETGKRNKGTNLFIFSFLQSNQQKMPNNLTNTGHYPGDEAKFI